MKVGINVKVDVTKIDKSRLFKGAKGTYLDLTTFIDTETVDQYENNGFISQSVDKDERESGEKGRILGNCKVFYKSSNGQASADSSSSYNSGSQAQNSNQNQQSVGAESSNFDDDMPF
tara:strand:+ start:579 stop:932 length:354 start_codon:yes stop_codon:yes gene_type:complete